MAKLPQVVRTLHATDYPTIDPTLLATLSAFMANVADAVGGGAGAYRGGGLTFSDNFQCDIITAKISHGVAFNVQPNKVKTPRSAIVLGADGAIPATTTATVIPRANGTCDIYVWFTNNSVTNISTSLLLLSDGISTTTLPSLQETWNAPTLLNAWVNFDAGGSGGHHQVGYMKDASEFVHLRGLVKSGTLPATIFTLPVGYRPASALNYSTIANAGAGEVFGSGAVDAAGNVVVNVGGNTYFSLANITFDTR